jgi:prophage DNA circulation protein
MSFAADLQRYAKKTGASLDETARAVTLEVFTSVIQDTPVDTGRARGNWQFTTVSPATGETDQSEASAIAAVQPKAGEVNYLTNNLPYIGRLEYVGWSNQAPNGMVRKNIARVRQIIRGTP